MDRLRRVFTHRDHEEGRDSGFTLVELMVAMGLFFTFLGLILTGVVWMSRGTSRVQLTSLSTSQALIVFENLDRQVRYADAINYPGISVATGYRYIEFRTPASSAASGLTTCTQWRYMPTEARIESRTWTDVVGATPTKWATKLTGAIDDGGVNYPFKLVPASISSSAMQQLLLTVHAGNANMGAGGYISTNFVARNSSITSPSNSDSNGDGISDSPVCLASGSRP